MADDDGWQVPFDQAVSVVVEMFHASATLSLEDPDGEIGLWDFPGFPVGDFMDAGLNIVGPWLNRRGLAYTTWQGTAPGQQTAVVYSYDGPEVDPRIIARRAN